MEPGTWTQEAIDALQHDVIRCVSERTAQDVKQRIRHALCNGYPVNAKASLMSGTLLHEVLKTGTLLSDVALELIQAGADPLMPDVLGRLPGHYATIHELTNVCKALGTAWINVKDIKSETPLEFALLVMVLGDMQCLTLTLQYLLPHCTEDILHAALVKFSEFEFIYDGEMVKRQQSRRWTVARAAWIAAAVDCSWM